MNPQNQLLLDIIVIGIQIVLASGLLTFGLWLLVSDREEPGE